VLVLEGILNDYLGNISCSLVASVGGRTKGTVTRFLLLFPFHNGGI